MTARQLSEWQAYDELEPIGIERIEYCIANLCSNIINHLWQIIQYIFGGKIQKTTSAKDFMPIWDTEKAKRIHAPKKQSIKEMKLVLQAIAATTGKKLKTNKDRR